MAAESGNALLRVYSRTGCHLCEELLESLLPMVRDRIDIEVVDIDDRADWTEMYGSRIPVVEFEGNFVCQYTLDRDRIATILNDLARS